VKRARAAAAIAAALCLTACAGMVRPTAPAGAPAQALWQARRAALAQVDHFALQGRLAQTGLTGFSGELSWIQNGVRFQVHFYGPLGVGAVAIEGQPGAVTVRTKQGSDQTNAPERLMQAKLGWSLPVDGLRYWVLGLPAPGTASELTLDPDGLLRSLEQDGWRLDYLEYQTADGWCLPRRFTLSDGQRSFRVAIDQWSLAP
jgi:outer membrane lipoprotein LolB